MPCGEVEDGERSVVSKEKDAPPLAKGLARLLAAV